MLRLRRYITGVRVFKLAGLPLGLSRRVHLRHVFFCFDAMVLWIG